MSVAIEVLKNAMDTIEENLSVLGANYELSNKHDENVIESMDKARADIKELNRCIKIIEEA